ncbi:hypothetical protein C8Q75DRAFT_535924 [Abortiporus biennis]|nr:hypothetical protein C8Q75DRAFT_535924 [Abortiporus biennis]
MSNGVMRIPVELILLILSFADLKTLIHCQGVSSHWRNLILHTQNDIPPARIKLLHFYNKLVKSQVFYYTRPYILPHLNKFDRQLYVSRLPPSTSTTPDEFKTWILEWPDKAVIGWLWPGLSGKHANVDSDIPGFSLDKRGINLLQPSIRFQGGPLVSEDIFLDPRSERFDMLYLSMMGAVGWESALWSEIGSDILEVNLLPIRRITTDDRSVALVVGSGRSKGGNQVVVGGLHKMGYCMTECLEMSWVDYLEEELLEEEKDFWVEGTRILPFRDISNEFDFLSTT